MDHLKLTVDKLSVDTISDLVVDDRCGAVSIFVGTTRDNFDGKKVLRLEYEAYEPMALKAMKGICDDVRKKWPAVHDIAIYHRLGAVPCREASVVIAISSPHRKESLDAVALAIDQLKASVPIWKKEVYEEGTSAWKENVESPMKSPPSAVQVDRSLVQITVSNEELQQRINKFIETKRNQVNINNIQDFIPSAPPADEAAAGAVDAETCARARAQFVRMRDRHGKSHLKIRRVHNEWGPMTAQKEELARLGRAGGGAGAGAVATLPAAIAERTRDIERFLKVEKVEPDIYRRLKVMEDKIAQLESISPEYAHFWSNRLEQRVKQEYSLDYAFTADDISRRIAELEKQ